MKIESKTVRLKVVRLGIECTASELSVLNANLRQILKRSIADVSTVTQELASAIDQAHQKALNASYRVRNTEHVDGFHTCHKCGAVEPCAVHGGDSDTSDNSRRR